MVSQIHDDSGERRDRGHASRAGRRRGENGETRPSNAQVPMLGGANAHHCESKCPDGSPEGVIGEIFSLVALRRALFCSCKWRGAPVFLGRAPCRVFFLVYTRCGRGVRIQPGTRIPCRRCPSHETETKVFFQRGQHPLLASKTKESQTNSTPMCPMLTSEASTLRNVSSNLRAGKSSFFLLPSTSINQDQLRSSGRQTKMRSTVLPHQAIVTADEPITSRGGDNTTTILKKTLSQQLLLPGHTACSTPRLSRPIKRKSQRTEKRENRPSRQDQRPPGTKRVPKREGNTTQNQVRQRGRLHLHHRRVARVFFLPRVLQMRCAARLASGGRARGATGLRGKQGHHRLDRRGPAPSRILSHPRAEVDPLAEPSRWDRFRASSVLNTLQPDPAKPTKKKQSGRHR